MKFKSFAFKTMLFKVLLVFMPAFLLFSLSSGARKPDWDELPKEIWQEYFERLDFKAKPVIVRPQIDFQFKQTLSKLIYEKGYKDKWVKASRNLTHIRDFLEYIDQRVNSDLGSIEAHLSFARFAEVQFSWKTTFHIRRKIYSEGKYLFIKHYDRAALKGSREAKVHLTSILKYCLEAADSPFAWLIYDSRKKNTLSKAKKLNFSNLKALIRKSGNQKEKEIFKILEKYSD